MIKSPKMSTKTEEKILAQLAKIESLLTTFVLTILDENHPTEAETLSFIEDGRKEHREGKTKELKSFSVLR